MNKQLTRSSQAREVAEILISNSADYSGHNSSMTRHHTISNMPVNLHDSLLHNEEYLHETLAAGAARDGRISAVRRFFCLFVTFDLLFTTLMWIICVVVSLFMHHLLNTNLNNLVSFVSRSLEKT